MTVPHSLRARLLWLLLAAILSTSIVQSVIAYRSARAEADSVFDYHMRQMAMSLRAGLPVSSGQGVVDAPGDDSDLDFVVQIWTENGLRIFESASRASLPQRAVLGFTDVKARGTTYRVFSLQSRSQVIQVAQDMAVRQEMARALALRTIAPTAIMAPLLMLLAWWVVTRSIRPIERVRREVSERQPDDLGEISDAGLPDEIAPLVGELNLLLARVRHALDSQQAFVADAAHELRTPLAALKLQVSGLERAASDSSRAVAVTRLHAGVDRASRLVEQLLALARQENGAGQTREPLSLAALVRSQLARTQIATPGSHATLVVGDTDEGLVAGSPDAIEVLLRNLIDNALKYTPTDGTVRVSVRRGTHSLTLVVEDSGPGIDAPERDRVLDRFYRVAGATGIGSGLGLAIVNAIAASHGATVQLDRSALLGGLRVRVSFANPTGAEALRTL